jgi:dipeptidyl aminopeptidase/acylaminoacyl peptidase
MPASLAPADLLRFAIPTDLALAPDCTRLAYAVTTQDADKDERRSAIWLLDLAQPDAPARQLTRGTHRDRSPQWSPDGAWLAFVSDRADGAQIWLLPADGGEPVRLTRMRHGASQPRWSPDGRALLFLAEVRPDADPILPADEDRTAREKQEKRDATRLRHMTRLQYRWDGYGDFMAGRQHIWRIDISDIVARRPGAMPPAPKPLTSGDYDHLDPAWSPDGAFIAFVSDRADDRDANRTDDLWVLEIASGALTRITTAPCENHTPAWSLDGRLAWFSQAVAPEWSHSNTHLWLAERAGDAWHARDALAGQDVNVGHGISGDIAALPASPPVWSADGRAIYLTANARGASNLHRLEVVEGVLTPLTEGAWQIGPLACVDERAIVAIAADPARPADLARFDLTGHLAAAQWLTTLNPWLAEYALSLPQEFAYTAPDGWQLQGWIVPPVAVASGAAPAILQIHGGPHGWYGPCYNATRQIFAGAGYAVVYVNPRGSIGYGEIFARASDRDWGGGDYLDIMAGLDAALARGGLDGGRLAVTGVSYGGYMTNWIIGHTDRFKAAVTVNSVSNLISSFGTSDIDTASGVVEQGGTPWDRRDWYLERSPITYADRITTPTRVIGAERDWRCPIEQSEQMYTAIRYLGRAATDFLRVPGTSHSIATGTPGQRVAYVRAVLEWIQRFVPVDATP